MCQKVGRMCWNLNFRATTISHVKKLNRRNCFNANFQYGIAPTTAFIHHLDVKIDLHFVMNSFTENPCFFLKPLRMKLICTCKELISRLISTILPTLVLLAALVFLPTLGLFLGGILNWTEMISICLLTRFKYRNEFMSKEVWKNDNKKPWR